MIIIKRYDLEKTPFNEAYNHIKSYFITSENHKITKTLLFSNGYELVQIDGDIDLLDLIIKRHSEENIND